MDPSNYTPAEERRIVEAVSGGETPPCPRCGGAFQETDVPPRRDVPYVRHRLWLVCGRCRRSLVVDRRHPG
ncbi:MAG TPA: hypothetical protein VE173_04210 [Longimicrobiales bacterium]|nr:hypothetical protein [Longimicrobiales bacterium]